VAKRASGDLASARPSTSCKATGTPTPSDAMSAGASCAGRRRSSWIRRAPGRRRRPAVRRHCRKRNRQPPNGQRRGRRVVRRDRRVRRARS
jgi:hypothetical protein